MVEESHIYKNVTNIGNIIKYFYTIRPDLKDKLLKEQVEMLDDMTDKDIFNYLESCGRGFGKSMISAGTGLYFADEWSTRNDKSITVLIVSSQKALYYNLGIFFRMKPELKDRLKIKGAGPREIPEEGVQFIDNLSRIIPVMATVHAVEGNRADVVIMDECQDIAEDVFLKALGCLKKDILGKLILIGTPYTEAKGKGGKLNWFIELVKNPKNYIKGYQFHLSQYPSNICNWNPHRMWKNAWGRERYDAECLGKVTPREKRSYYPSVNIKKCCYDIEPTPEGGERATREVGIDCGFKKTVYTLTERIGTVKRKILFIEIWENRSIEELAPIIAKLINNQNVDIVKIDSKQGIDVPSYYLEIKKYTNKNLVKIDSSLKDKVINEKGEEQLITVKGNMLGQLGRKLREGNMIIPMRMKYADKLVDQLVKYHPRRNREDDIVDSLLLSVYERKSFDSGKYGKVFGPWSLKK